MATNKNAIVRYRVLDNCFRNLGKQYFINDLIEECEKVLLEIDPDSNGISLRQIRDDIAFMKSKEGWEIELGNFRMGHKLYYRYEDPSFSINNMPLNELEINQLCSAIDILSQFKGMPQFEWINEMIPKLRMRYSTGQVSKKIMDFDSNQYLKGIEHLGPLYNAILYKKVLRINYQPYEEEKAIALIIHPYFLKQYNNRWFLFGLNQENGKYDWNLALDRILSLEETNIQYEENNEANWTEYFEDIIGVTKPIDKKAEKVILHFFDITGKYMETKPIHGSQKSKWINSTTLEVTLEIIINYELERLIISYADSVKVIVPVELAKIISGRINNAAILYFNQNIY